MKRRLLHSRLPLPWILAWRYMRGERSRILSSTAWAAFLATALGVTAMVVAMALMTGYTEDLERKLIGLQGEVIASPLETGAFEASAEAFEQIAQLDGVKRLGRVAYGEGSLTSPALPEGASVVLRGVEPRSDPTVLKIAGPDAAVLLAPDERGVPGVLLGKELERQLAVAPGALLRLVVLSLGERRPRFRYRSVRFAGTFSTGFAEFDARWVVLDREVVVRARGDTGLEVMEFQLSDTGDPETTAVEIEAQLGTERWLVQRWRKINRQLFQALRLQEFGLFLVLGLIVLVSTFNVASTLVILVRERMRDIGVLGSLGLTPRKLWWTFVTYGLVLGAQGTLAGVLVGGLASWIVTEFELVSFGPEIASIYFIDSVPFRVELGDVMAIVGFALGVNFLACALPALRAAWVRPSMALRDE